MWCTSTYCMSTLQNGWIIELQKWRLEIDSSCVSLFPCFCVLMYVLLIQTEIQGRRKSFQIVHAICISQLRSMPAQFTFKLQCAALLICLTYVSWEGWLKYCCTHYYQCDVKGSLILNSWFDYCQVNQTSLHELCCELMDATLYNLGCGQNIKRWQAAKVILKLESTPGSAESCKTLPLPV